MTSTDATPAALGAHLDALRAGFSLGDVPVPVVRANRLRRLADGIVRRADEVTAAVDADFGGRSELETLAAEVGLTAQMLRHMARRLPRWVRPVARPTLASGVPGIARLWVEPKGVAGVIAPWNYPFQLAVLPTATALAAGCKAMLKPSEFAPRTGALVAEIMGDVWGEDDLRVVTGDADVARAFSALPFDHLFFTGSTETGRAVARAAAANLTPVTLELGGKSPCLMMPDARPDRHAALAGWGKWFSAGQTCVAADFLLVPRGTGPAWADAMLGIARRFAAEGRGYTAIASDRHLDRLRALLEEARAAGAEIREAPLPEGADGRRMAPSVVLGAPDDCRLMQEEVFGPVLPIREYDGLDEALAWLAARPAPLAAYAFGADARRARRALGRIRSGGGAVNATMMHLAVRDMPFGGIGPSGMGAYRGRDGVMTFSHRRTVLEVPRIRGLAEMLLPPFDARARRAIRWLSR
jgi:coniferyl-aldehyde dehydrogenase